MRVWGLGFAFRVQGLGVGVYAVSVLWQNDWYSQKPWFCAHTHSRFQQSPLTNEIPLLVVTLALTDSGSQQSRVHTRHQSFSNYAFTHEITRSAITLSPGFLLWNYARRFQAKREHLEMFQGLEPGIQGQNLASTVLYVPHSLDSKAENVQHAAAEGGNGYHQP